MTLSKMLSPLFFAVILLAAPMAQAEEETFTVDEVRAKAEGFFGEVTEGLAEGIEKVFADQGRPNAIILGEEVSGAIGVGLRYGEGMLEFKTRGGQKVYWQGPSIGWDLGGNASKVMALVYDLPSVDSLYRRFPGVDGSFYVVAGASVSYQRADDIVIAPIRTGVGLRTGANIGYLHFGDEFSVIPF